MINQDKYVLIHIIEDKLLRLVSESLRDLTDILCAKTRKDGATSLGRLFEALAEIRTG
jgi:hypothetical protein